VMRDMRAHNIDMLTIGQYLAPSGHHLPVRRYVHPDTFKMFEAKAYEMGFTHAAVGAMVRSSYHADQQAQLDLRVVVYCCLCIQFRRPL
jgi:lipoyl synthase